MDRRETEIYDSPAISANVDELDRLVGPSCFRGWTPKFTHVQIKQTYSVHVYDGQQAPNRRVKLHITAYFSRRQVEDLHTVDEHPALRSIVVPPGMYRSARIGKPRSGETSRDEDVYRISKRPTVTVETDGYEKLPPILVPGSDSPTFSDDYLETAYQRSDSMGYSSPGPMFSRRQRPSSSCQEGTMDWEHGRQGVVGVSGGSEAGRRTPLPPLNVALSSIPWSPTQRYAEDDVQLARLDVARALV